nr:Unknown Function [uncultured bacterium]AIA16218.1 Unknown Function [uncultured bacterium]
MREKLLNILRNWNPEIEFTVKIKFVQKGTQLPITGEEYIARLYDRDLFTDDDYLGHSGLNDKGEAHIHFFPSDIFNSDLGFEDLPDLYVLLFKGDVVHFQTKVWDNVDFDKLGLLDMREGEVVNFGTFLID